MRDQRALFWNKDTSQMDSICMAFFGLHSYFFCLSWILSAFQVLIVLEAQFSSQTEETNNYHDDFLKDLIFAQFKLDSL